MHACRSTLEDPTFKVAGVSIASARFVSVIYGLAALLLTWALGRRLGGPWVGLGAAALLVLLRLNLTPFTGLTLTDLGATVRYDLVTVPYGLGASLLLLKRRDAEHAPPLVCVALAGALLGLAALTQFIGAMFGPPLALYLLTLRNVEHSRRLLLAGVLTVAAIVPFLSYAAYIAPHVDDFRGQARAVEQSTDFASPRFYVEQLKREPSRFKDAIALDHLPSSPGDLVRRPSARLALLVLAPLAAFWMLWMPWCMRWSKNYESSYDTYCLIAWMVFGLIIELALFESTKRFVYWVVVVPFLCIAIADLLQILVMGAFGGILGQRDLKASSIAGMRQLGVSEKDALAAFGPDPWRARAAAAGLLTVIAIFAIEGFAVAAKDVRDARNTGDYGALGRKLEAVVPPGAVTMGDNRLWLAMRSRPYRSLHLLFYETNPDISRDRVTDIPGVFDRTHVDYLLLSPISYQQLKLLSPGDAQAFQRYVDTHMELVTKVEDRTYGPIDVYRLRN